MEKTIPLIAQMPLDEYVQFCRWLRECCGCTLSELLEMSPRYQKDAVVRFYEECSMA